MRDGLPRAVVRLLLIAFSLSLLALFSWFAYFVLRAPGVVVEQVGAVRGLWLTAGLAAFVALTSGALAFHHKREAYGSGEEVLFRVCLIVATGILLCSAIWASAIALSG